MIYYIKEGKLVTILEFDTMITPDFNKNGLKPSDVRVFIKLKEGNIKIITLKGIETEVILVESMIDFINSKFIYTEKVNSYSLISLLKDIDNDSLMGVLNYKSPYSHLFNEEKAKKITSSGVKLLKSITSKLDKPKLHFENKEILIGHLFKDVILSKVYTTFEVLCDIFDINKSRVTLVIKNHKLYVNVIGLVSNNVFSFIKTLKYLYKEINIIEEETTDGQTVENKESETKHDDGFYLSPKLQDFIRQTLSLKISNSPEYIVMCLRMKQDGDEYVIKCEFDDGSTETDVLLTGKYDLNYMLSEIKKFMMTTINSILISEYTIDSEVIHSSTYPAHKKDYATISYVFSKKYLI